MCMCCACLGCRLVQECKHVRAFGEGGCHCYDKLKSARTVGRLQKSFLLRHTAIVCFFVTADFHMFSVTCLTNLSELQQSIQNLSWRPGSTRPNMRRIAITRVFSGVCTRRYIAFLAITRLFWGVARGETAQVPMHWHPIKNSFHGRHQRGKNHQMLRSVKVLNIAIYADCAKDHMTTKFKYEMPEKF